MRLAKLGNAGALPAVPTVGSGHWRFGGVGLHNRDVVSVAGEHRCCAEPNDAATADQDLAHVDLLQQKKSNRGIAAQT